MKQLTPNDHSLYMGSSTPVRLTENAIGGAPDFMRPLRPVFLSDIHLRAATKDAQLTALMREIAACQPDLLLLGGDYAERRDQYARFFHALRNIRCPLGAYAVLGNNDRENFRDLREFTDLARESGVRLLINECVRIPLAGGTLEIGGCDEHKYGTPITRDLFTADESAYRILLSHFPLAPDCRVDLMLSGHTHGGQLNIFGMTPYALIHFERHLQPLLVRGTAALKGGGRLLVSCGIGTSRVPLRIGAAPEMHRLRFLGSLADEEKNIDGN